MRVLLVAKPWRGGLADYVAAALRDLVGEVTYVPTRPVTLADHLLAQRDKNRWRAKVLSRIEQAEYDAALFITPPDYVAEIARPQKHAIWLVDDAKINTAMAESMGHIFLSDPGYVAELKAAIPAQHYAGVLPFAMLPATHRTAAKSAPSRDLCFIANTDAKRDTWLIQFFAADMPCHVYGNYFLNHSLFWQHPFFFHPRTTCNAMQSVYARYRLSLNIHANIVREGTNMRSYEAAGYGITQLVKYRPGIETLFDIEKELPCFRSIEEAKAIHDRLLGDPNAAQQIAANAQKRVLSEHTYQQRMRTILARFG